MKHLTPSHAIGRKAIATMTAAALVFGGVTAAHTVIAPATVAAAESITSMPASDLASFQPYSPADDNREQDAQAAELLNSFSQYGFGWCVDLSSNAPTARDNVDYELGALDEFHYYQAKDGRGQPYTNIKSGLYKFNGSSQFEQDVRAAVINLVKKGTQAYAEGDVTTAAKVNMALRVFLGHNQNSTTRAAYIIQRNGRDNYAGSRGYTYPETQRPTMAEFEDWTGFTIVGAGNYPSIMRIDIEIPQPNPDEYVTIMAPDDFKWKSYTRFGTFDQRLIPPHQPGLDDPTTPPSEPEEPTTEPEVPTEEPEEPTTEPEVPTTEPEAPTTEPEVPTEEPEEPTTEPEAPTTEPTEEDENLDVYRYVFSWALTQPYNISEEYVKFEYDRDDVRIVTGEGNFNLEYDANGNLFIVPVGTGAGVFEITDSNGEIHRYEFNTAAG